MSDSSTAERILLVEDDDSFRRALVEVLETQGFSVSAVAHPRDVLDALQAEEIDVVVTDLVMPGMQGGALMERVKEAFPAIPVIAMTAFGSIEGALDLTRAGAADYLAKPFRTHALLDALRRVLDESRPFREGARARRGVGEHLGAIVGASRPMLGLFERVARVADSPAPVLITGETGTGKELVARAVHRGSGRNPFIPLNCGALPEHLTESELFGHAAGAFTGADRAKPGLWEAADGGTLFLDEVAELPTSLQPKLLRVLEAGKVRRLGELTERPIGARVIAATNRDLSRAVEEGTFREDLYWRLNVLHLHVPPLRDRRADIPLLVEELLSRIPSRDGTPPTLTPDALGALVTHPWPGNVRQLRNVLERSVAFSDGPRIGISDLKDIPRPGEATALVEGGAGREATLAEIERAYVLEILRRTDGNKTEAAHILGIPRRTLYRRLAEYDQ